MIYFIVSTSIYNDCDIRKKQYINGITTLQNIINDKLIDNYKIIIIENNGLRKTFLDDLGYQVFYTNNNSIPTKNKGIKELTDVFDCIHKFNINDNDFIVKITGRYVLDTKSEFMNILKNINNTKFDCIIKYGPFFEPVDYKTKDCITGLIGMRCYYVKQIYIPTETEWVEWKWAEATYLMDDNKICKVQNLGINMCPDNNTYFYI